jgi:lipopolysaccharide/colanic/teichoic acid biosynthesis glycosyltransferase
MIFIMFAIIFLHSIALSLMKRFLDLFGSCLGLVLLSPLLSVFSLLIWAQDRHSPFYVAPRIGRNGKPFNMVKLRSMSVNADSSGVDSTANNDPRITPIGSLVREYKLDEFMQLWNVFLGQMSLVGPRPNVERETQIYTPVERKLLSVKPGITDFSSIVFSDEGRILNGAPDPDIAYHQLIRPYKSALGLFYVQHRTFHLDIIIILTTLLSLISRKLALRINCAVLACLGSPLPLLQVASRANPLVPSPPPGSFHVVTCRSGSASSHD